MLLRTIIYIHAVKVEGVLKTRHAGDEEFLAVRSPERNTEVLVEGRIEISPYDGSRFLGCDIHDSDTHLRIGLTSLRVTGLTERSAKTQVSDLRTLRLRRSCRRIGICRINREERNLGIVKTIESDLLAVWRPPESLITGRTTENLFVIHP